MKTVGGRNKAERCKTAIEKQFALSPRTQVFTATARGQRRGVWDSGRHWDNAELRYPILRASQGSAREH